MSLHYVSSQENEEFRWSRGALVAFGENVSAQQWQNFFRSHLLTHSSQAKKRSLWARNREKGRGWRRLRVFRWGSCRQGNSVERLSGIGSRFTIASEEVAVQKRNRQYDRAERKI